MLDYPFNLKSVFCVTLAGKMRRCDIFPDIRTLKEEKNERMITYNLQLIENKDIGCNWVEDELEGIPLRGVLFKKKKKKKVFWPWFAS